MLVGTEMGRPALPASISTEVALLLPGQLRMVTGGSVSGKTFAGEKFLSDANGKARAAAG